MTPIPSNATGEIASMTSEQLALARLRVEQLQLQERVRRELRAYVTDMSGAFASPRKLPALVEEMVAQFLGFVEGRITFAEMKTQLRVWVRLGLAPSGAFAVADALGDVGKTILAESEILPRVTDYRQKFMLSYEEARRTHVLVEQERMQRSLHRAVEQQIVKEREARRELQHRQSQLQLAANLARVATAARDLNDLLSAVARELCETLGLDFVGMYLVDEFQQRAVLRAGAGELGKHLLSTGNIQSLSANSPLAYALLNREMVLLTDGNAAQRVFLLPVEPKTPFTLIVPLTARAKTFGAFSAHSHTRNLFSPQDLPVLSLIADTLANAIENTELLERTQATVQELERAQRTYTLDTWMPAQARAQVVYSQKQDEFQSETPQIEKLAPAPTRGADGASQLSVPVTLRGEVIGTVDLFDVTQTRSWSESEKALATSVVEQMALAVENARLFEQAQRRAQETAIVNELARALSGELDSAKLFATVYEYLPRLMATDALLVWLYDESTQTVTRPALYDLGVFYADDEGARPPAGNVARVITTGQPVVINHTREEWQQERARTQAIIGSSDPSASLLYVPLRVGARLRGVMSVQSYQFNVYDAPQVELFTSVANYLASALENAELFAETNRRLHEVSVLHDSMQTLTQALQVDVLLERIVKQFATVLDVDSSTILEWDRNTREMVLLYDFDPNPPHGDSDETRFALDHYPDFEDFLSQGKMQVFHRSDAKLSQTMRADMENWNWQTLLLVPLLRQNQVTGVIELGDRRQERQFSPEELRLASSLANQAAVVLENARLFEQTEQALTETQLLYRIGEQLNQVLSLEELVRTAAQPAFERGAGSSQLLLLDYQGQQNPTAANVVVNLLATGEPAPFSEYTHFPIERFTLGKTLMANPRDLVTIEDVNTSPILDEATRGVLLASRTQATVLLPLSVEQRILGVIVIGWETPHAFNAQERRIYQALASQMALVLNNRLLFEQTQEALEETQSLYGTSALLNAAMNVQDALEAAAGPAIMQGAQSANLLGIETDAQKRPEYGMIIAGWSSTGVESRFRNYRFQFSQVPMSNLWIENPTEPVLVDDIETDPRVDETAREFYRRANTRATALLPLRLAERWVGIIVISWDKPRAFNERDVRLYHTIMSQATTVLDNRRLFEQIQEALAETQTLYEIGARLTAATTMQQALEAAIGPAVVQGAVGATLSRTYIDTQGMPEEIQVLALWPQTQEQEYLVGMRVPYAFFASAYPAPHLQTGLVMSEDVESDSAIQEMAKEFFRENGIAAFVSLPLYVGERQVGFLSFNWNAPHRFSAAELRMYRAVASQTATVADNRVLFEQTQEALAQTQTALAQVQEAQDRLNLQYQTANILARATSFEHAVPLLLQNTCRSLNWQVGEHWELDSVTNRLVLAHVWNEDAPVLHEFTAESYRLSFAPGEGLPGRTWAAERPIWVPDIVQEPIFENIDKAQQAGIVSALAFPLQSEARLFGVTVFFSTRHQELDDTLMATMVGVGSQIGQYRERRNAEEAVRQQNTYLNALHETTLGLMRRLDLEELLQSIIMRAGELVGTGHGYVHLLEPSGTELRMHVGIGIYQDFVGTRVKAGQGLAGTILQSGEPIIVDDYRHFPGRLPMVDRDVLRAVAGVPLKSGDQTVGVLGLASLEEGRRFTTTQVEALNRFAELAAIALDNAQLYDASQQALLQTRRLAQREKASAEIADKLYAAPDVKTVLQTAAEELRRSTGSRRAVVRLHLGKNGETKTSETIAQTDSQASDA